MPITQIDSPQNATIKSVAKLRTRRGRQQQERIIIDGQREVSRAIVSGIEIESIFLQQPSAHSDEAERWSEVAKGAQIYGVGERALAKIAFGDRQEVVAVAKTPNRSLEQLLLGESPQLIAVLESIEKPGNVGAVMRSADAAGIKTVILVDPATDLFNPNAIRASLGTIFSLQVASTSFDEYLTWSKQREIKHFLAKCDSSAKDYGTVSSVSKATDMAIVLGSEAKGLSHHWNSVSGTSIKIPMRGIADSLNISAAAAVLFYEYSKRFGADCDHT